ncbi:MAG TPA: hypothetical protein VFE94_03205 [Candidatus Paceibacterota bacterium]|nr:hypothetical protein [Candidatus Paceibacterota bacterium]
MSKPLVIGTIVAVVGIFALGGFLLWQNVSNQVTHTPEQQTPPPPVPSPQPQAIDNQQSEIDTSNWQTYRSDEFGFEVKMPENWMAREFEVKIDLGIFNLPEYYAVSVSKIENNEGMTNREYAEQWFESRKDLLSDYEVSSTGAAEVSVGEYVGYKIQGFHTGIEGESTIDVIFVELPNDDSIYQVQFPTGEFQTGQHIISPEENYQIANQILSTFRFVE